MALAGGVAGALLLLTTSPATFDDVVPWLVLGAAALFAAQPTLRRVLDRGSAHPRTRPVLLVAGVFAASVYGGDFGAAMGVMFLAVLGLALPALHRPHERPARGAVHDRQRRGGRRVRRARGPRRGGSRAARSWAASSGATSAPVLRWRCPRRLCRVVVVVIGVGTAVKLLV